MKTVTILATYHTMATTIFGPMDILNQAGRLFNRVTDRPQTPFFDVAVASADGRAIRSLNKIEIQPHCSIDAVTATDLIIISSTTYIDNTLERNPELIAWLQHHYDRGAHIASICTGVFLLAETGLLDGKSATLHWGFADLFRQRYPKVRLEHDQMVLDHGRLYCSAGVSAGMDLALYLVDKFCGRPAAVQSAKSMVLDLNRTRQTPYGISVGVKNHNDDLVHRVQDWMARHQHEAIDYLALAKQFGLSRRSLERRFKQILGVTPLGYLQQLRVEKAKEMLEEGNLTFNEITYGVGYEDVSFFRKLFTRHTGLGPRAYQQTFGGRAGR